MPHSNIITATDEEQTWVTIAEQLKTKKEDKDYTAQFTLHNHTVTIDIDYHPESSETGVPSTLFSSQLEQNPGFRFSLFKQDIKNQIKKLFGMQDVVIGHDEVDRKFIIKSNDEQKIKQVLNADEVVKGLVELPIISFELREVKIGAHREVVITLEVEGRVINPADISKIYKPFNQVLQQLK